MKIGDFFKKIVDYGNSVDQDGTAGYKTDDLATATLGSNTTAPKPATPIPAAKPSASTTKPTTLAAKPNSTRSASNVEETWKPATKVTTPVPKPNSTRSASNVEETWKPAFTIKPKTDTGDTVAPIGTRREDVSKSFTDIYSKTASDPTHRKMYADLQMYAVPGGDLDDNFREKYQTDRDKLDKELADTKKKYGVGSDEYKALKKFVDDYDALAQPAKIRAAAGNASRLSHQLDSIIDNVFAGYTSAPDYQEKVEKGKKEILGNPRKYGIFTLGMKGATEKQKDLLYAVFADEGMDGARDFYRRFLNPTVAQVGAAQDFVNSAGSDGNEFWEGVDALMGGIVSQDNLLNGSLRRAYEHLTGKSEATGEDELAGSFTVGQAVDHTLRQEFADVDQTELATYGLPGFDKMTTDLKGSEWVALAKDQATDYQKQLLGYIYLASEGDEAAVKEFWDNIYDWAQQIRATVNGDLFSETTQDAVKSGLYQDYLETSEAISALYKVALTTGSQLSRTALSFVPIIGQALSLGTMGVSVAGDVYAAERAEGKTKGATGYAISKGLVEVGTETLLGGVLKVPGLLVNAISKNFVQNMTSPFLRFVTRLGNRFWEEGGEEVLSDLADPLLVNLWYGEGDLAQKLKATGAGIAEAYKTGEFTESFLLGGASALMLGAAGEISNTITESMYYDLGTALNTMGSTRKLIDMILNNPLTEEQAKAKFGGQWKQAMKEYEDAKKMAEGLKDGSLKDTAFNVGEAYVKFGRSGGDVSWLTNPDTAIYNKESLTVENLEAGARSMLADLKGDVELAAAIARAAAGELISNEQIQAIKADEKATLVLSQLMGELDMSQDNALTRAALSTTLKSGTGNTTYDTLKTVNTNQTVANPQAAALFKAGLEWETAQKVGAVIEKVMNGEAITEAEAKLIDVSIPAVRSILSDSIAVDLTESSTVEHVLDAMNLEAQNRAQMKSDQEIVRETARQAAEARMPIPPAAQAPAPSVESITIGGTVFNHDTFIQQYMAQHSGATMEQAEQAWQERVSISNAFNGQEENNGRGTIPSNTGGRNADLASGGTVQTVEGGNAGPGSAENAGGRSGPAAEAGVHENAQTEQKITRFNSEQREFMQTCKAAGFTSVTLIRGPMYLRNENGELILDENGNPKQINARVDADGGLSIRWDNRFADPHRVARHEMLHLWLSELQKKLGYAARAAYVRDALYDILGGDETKLAEFEKAYAEKYALAYAGLSPEAFQDAVYEEILSDMYAGLNFYGVNAGEYQDAAEMYVSETGLREDFFGEDHTNDYEGIDEVDLTDPFRDSTDFNLPPDVRPFPGEKPMHDNLKKFSLTSMAEGGNFELQVNDSGEPFALIDKATGERVTNVTADMMIGTPMGDIIQMAVDNGNITEADAKKQRQMLADAMNMIVEYKDAAIVWELVGSQLFSAIKSNSDKQYNKTIDFSTICKKTMAIVDAMSETMKKLGRGLTRREVEIVYEEVGKAGEATPCPVCYVFSRWMGIGNLLDQIRVFQEEYAGKSEEELLSFMSNIEEQARLYAEASSASKKEDFYDKDGKLKIGKVISDMKSKPNSRAASAMKKLNQHQQAVTMIDNLTAAMETAGPEQVKRYKELIKKLKGSLLKESQIQDLQQQMAENDQAVSVYEAYQWLAKTVMMADMSEVNEDGEAMGGWKKNPNFKPVPNDILFDLNRGGDFAKDYPLTWAFRTGKGCAMGKAITPYADARVGETIQGVALGDVKAIRVGADINEFLNGDTKKQKQTLESARKKMKRQNLIGGMRYQSTSDFRYEFGSDYLMTFLEMQALGANVQLYTKVIESVDFLASMGADCNLSVMPRGDGYVVDPVTGKKTLDFSDVTGINAKAAIKKSQQYDNVQLILVGINDTNIRLALEGTEVTFVIPFHGSGQSVHQVQTLMDLIGEGLDVAQAQDYTSVQSDHVSKNQTAEQKAMWDLRMAIIMGECENGLTTAQKALLAKNKHLQKLYDMFYVTESDPAYHNYLAKDQAEHIFPYEYWNKDGDYDHADENGRIFQEYCASMGIIPRFSGINSKGEKVGFGDFTKDKGYWKLLIDRSMYENVYDENGEWIGYGKYRPQKQINVSNMKLSDLDPETGKAQFTNGEMSKQYDATRNPADLQKRNDIVGQSIQRIEAARDKGDVFDQTQVNKGFRTNIMAAKSELRNRMSMAPDLTSDENSGIISTEQNQGSEANATEDKEVRRERRVHRLVERISSQNWTEAYFQGVRDQVEGLRPDRAWCTTEPQARRLTDVAAKFFLEEGHTFAGETLLQTNDVINYGIQDFLGWFFYTMYSMPADEFTKMLTEKIEDADVLLRSLNKAMAVKDEAEFPENFTPTEADARYMKAIKSGDIATLQDMVRDAAHKAGYNMELYQHSAGRNRFEAFDRGDFGFHLGSWAQAAHIVSRDRNRTYDPALVIPLYADIQNDVSAYEDVGTWDVNRVAESLLTSFDDGLAEDLAPYEEELNRIAGNPRYATNRYNSWQRKELTDILEAAGYDAIYYWNSYEDDYEREEHDSYLIWKPNQMKSADLITYDQDGKVIPLSQRFDRSKPEYRYSLALDDAGFETSNNEAPVTDERGQVLYVAPSSDAWAVARDTDGSLLNTEYIQNELGLPIYDNPHDEYVPEKRGAVIPKASDLKHKTANSSTEPSYVQAFDYLTRTGKQGARVLDASSGLGHGVEYGRSQGFDVTDLEPYSGGRPVDFRKYGGLIAAIENGEEEPFDFIISNAVINVMAQDAREELLANLIRMLKPGGELFINPAFAKEWDGYKKAISLEEYKRRVANGEDVSKINVIMAPSTKTTGGEIYTAQSKSIQKGYTDPEFMAFAKDVAKQTLGEDIKIEKGSKLPGLNKGFVITRNGKAAPQQGTNAPSAIQQRYSVMDAEYNDWAPEFYSKMANVVNEWTNGKGQPLGAKMAAGQPRFSMADTNGPTYEGPYTSEKEWRDAVVNRSVDYTPEMEERWGLSGGDMMDADAAITELLDKMDEIEARVKKGGEWYARDIRDLYWFKEGFTDFIDLMRSPNGENMLRFMLRNVDPRSLKNLKWYPIQIYDGVKNRYRQEISAFNKIVDERLKEHGYRSLKIKGNKSYTLSEIRDMFNKLNKDADTAALAKRVFDTAEKLTAAGLSTPFKFRSIPSQKGTIKGGEHFAGSVDYNTAYFNSAKYSDQEKAHTLLHELIHSYSAGIINLVSRYSPYVNYSPETIAVYNALSQDVIDAVHTLNDIYDEIKYDPDFVDEDGDRMYGAAKNSKEMIAELSDPEFRAKLKKKNLLQRIIDAVKKLFGIQPSNAYDAVSAAFDKILTTYEDPDFQEADRNYLRSTGGAQRFSVADDQNNPYPEGSLNNTVYDLLDKINSPQELQDWVNGLREKQAQSQEWRTTPPTIPSKDRATPVNKVQREIQQKQLEKLIEKYGAFPKGENPARDISIPQQTNDTTRVGRFARTAAEAEGVSQRTVDQITNSILTNDLLTYSRIPDTAAIARADQEFDQMGYKKAVKDWEKRTAYDHNPTKYDIAFGERLLIEADRNGDTATAMRTVAELTAMTRQAGQVVQAASLLKKLGPVGQLYYIQQAVDRLNKQNQGRIAKGRMAPIVIDQALAEAVLTADTQEEIDKAMEKLLDDIASKVPLTMKDRWDAWRYLSMLGNPRTHIRNIFGNAIFAPVRLASDILSATGQRMFIRDAKQRTRDAGARIGGAKYNKIREFAKADFEEMRPQITGTGKMNPLNEILSRRKAFPKALGFLNKWSDWNSTALDKEDFIFMQKAYVDAMTQFIAARGLSLEELSGDGQSFEGAKALNEARAFAALEAQKATYRDFSALANHLNALKRAPKIGWLIDGILPFTKTPMNILRRGIEYSPIGLANGIYGALMQVQKGDISAAEAIDRIAAGMTGSMIAALGWFLARAGLAKGGGKDDEKEDALEKAQGHQNYSIEINGNSYTIDWAAPVALPFFVGVEAYNRLTDGTKSSIWDWADIASLIAEPMLSLSMLDGLNSTLSSVRYGDKNEALSTIVLNMVQSYISQGVPTIGGQIARIKDPVRRSTYVDKNSETPDWLQRFLQGAQAKNPNILGLMPNASDKMAYVDVWGRKDTNESVFWRGFENFFSPGYYNRINETPIDVELQRLYEATGDNEVLPSVVAKYFQSEGERLDLTAQQYEKYKTTTGQTAFSLLGSLMDDIAYISMDDEQKAQAVKKILDAATAIGKKSVAPTYKAENWIERAEAHDNIETAAMFQTLKGLKTGLSDYQIIEAMSWLTDEERGTLIMDSRDNTDRNMTDYTKKKYKFVLTDEQIKREREIYESMFWPAYTELIYNQKFMNADLAGRSNMIKGMQSDLGEAARRALGDELRAAGYTSVLLDDSDVPEQLTNLYDILNRG